MSLRAQFEKQCPGVYFLDPSDLAGIEAYLRSIAWLSPSEEILSAGKAGEGNMNCTLRIRTTERSFILKQARPWVEKYSHIPAPCDRALVEAEFYEWFANEEQVASRMPKLLGVDRAARLLMLEDLGTAHDFTFLYAGGTLDNRDVETLVDYLRHTRRASQDAPHPPILLNRAMRKLNHEHIFDLPLRANNGFDLDAITPGLTEVAREFQGDLPFLNAVRKLGELYLADGAVLAHGDYFPGSWLKTSGGPRIIDPEFCFFGPAEFDPGVMLAHLHLAAQPIPEALSKYAAELDTGLVWQFAGVEIMRRVIGVAQLPLTCGLADKARLLTLSRTMILTP
jgi:5-methylthioribose kinase